MYRTKIGIVKATELKASPKIFLFSKMVQDYGNISADICLVMQAVGQAGHSLSLWYNLYSPVRSLISLFKKLSTVPELIWDVNPFPPDQPQPKIQDSPDMEASCRRLGGLPLPGPRIGAGRRDTWRPRVEARRPGFAPTGWLSCPTSCGRRKNRKRRARKPGIEPRISSLVEQLQTNLIQNGTQSATESVTGPRC